MRLRHLKRRSPDGKVVLRGGVFSEAKCPSVGRMVVSAVRAKPMCGVAGHGMVVISIDGFALFDADDAEGIYGALREAIKEARRYDDELARRMRDAGTA